jgi:hypothetical protein
MRKGDTFDSFLRSRLSVLVGYRRNMLQGTNYEPELNICGSGSNSIWVRDEILTDEPLILSSSS